MWIYGDTLAARMIAVALTAPRFRGRAELFRLAEAQAALPAEHRPAWERSALYAIELTPRQREIAAVRGELDRHVVDALALPCVREQTRIRAERVCARRITDPLAAMRPGNVLERATRRAFLAALKIAGFRGAIHLHLTAIDFVARGAEGASSETGSTSPHSVGLPSAYATKGFAVTTSAHHFCVSPAIFAVPCAERAVLGMVYITPDLRVRQSRGTSLVVERRRGPHGGWS